MKLSLSLVLITCSMGLSLAIVARASTDMAAPPSAAGPLLVPSDYTRAPAAAQREDAPIAADWTPVRQLTPGREIVVTVKGAPAATRYFVLADESVLTVLDLTDPTLPGSARDALRDMASQHPEYFAAVLQGSGQFAMGDVRLARTGILVANRKVAEFDHVVQQIARADVVRVTTKVGASARQRVVVGAGLGGFLCSGGGWIGLAVCGPLGAGLGYASTHKADEVVYPYQAILPPAAQERTLSPDVQAASAAAPDTSGPAAAPVSRFSPARRLIRADAGRVKEATGALVSDPLGRTILFEVDGREAFAIPYERITAMHYEQAQYPERFLGRPSFYVTIHYADAAGQAAFETVRLLSTDDVLPVLDALERDTRLTVDRTLTTRSFLGIPVRARIGTRVAVTDHDGQSTKGTITQLSASSVTLEESAGALRTFEAADVQKIRLLYSPKHDLVVGLGFGVTIGAASALMAAGLSGCYNDTDNASDCQVLAGTAAAAGVLGGIGALIGTGIGAIRYPSNRAFDVYLGSAPASSATSAITIAPQVSQSRKAVLVLVSF